MDCVRDADSGPDRGTHLCMDDAVCIGILPPVASLGRRGPNFSVRHNTSGATDIKTDDVIVVPVIICEVLLFYYYLKTFT